MNGERNQTFPMIRGNINVEQNVTWREEGITMEPVYYTVDSIDGDYAHMISDSGVENQVAMFLLPEGTDVGSRLVRENFEWSLL